MPGHHVSHGDFAAKIAELEAAGETVAAITTDESGVYIVTVPKVQRRRPGQTETRA